MAAWDKDRPEASTGPTTAQLRARVLAATTATNSSCLSGNHGGCPAEVYVGHDGAEPVYRPCACSCHAVAA